MVDGKVWKAVWWEADDVWAVVMVDVFRLERGVRWKELNISWQKMWIASSFLMTASEM